MPTLPLRLISSAAQQPVRAGFLPGSDVAAWLGEMARHPGARFFIVPNSVEDADAGGLLILPTGETSEKLGPRVLPCGLALGRVVVPLGHRLDPILSEEEARRLLNYAAYFFHPALGLVAFEETDAISPESLIVPPLPRESTWMRAMPGHPLFAKLRRVMLVLPDDLAGLFGDAAQDIGSQSPKDLQGKAPLLDRLKDKLIGGAAIVGLGGLAALAGIIRLFGGKGGVQKPTGNAGSGKPSANVRGIPMLNQLMQWTAEQMEKLAQKRERELERLMKLLETDPEKGLRYALPFTDAGDASRGTAPPSWQLGERNPIFGSRRGGGPADVWGMSPQTQWQLQQKYRDLANRELAAGRYDRAAYIFAELLGDWHAAAGALARGKRYQEASRIYLTKLNNKPLAAKCLEDGGLLTDAVLLYAELGQHEKCGDLLRHLGREREAIAAYHEAIKGSTDRLHDARILFEKLQQHTLALQVLASGYPHSPQACQCLERHFEYLTRLDAAEPALQLARSLAAPERQVSDRVLMTETLRSIHSAQTAPEVRQRIAQVAITVIGDALASTSGTKESALLAALPQFASSDLLLRRDSQRFADAREQARRSAQKKNAENIPLTRQALFALKHQGSLKLPQDGTTWEHLISQGEKWLAVGTNQRTSQAVWVCGNGEQIRGKLCSASGWEHLTNLMPTLPPLPELAWLPFARKGEAARYGQARNADFASSPNTREMLIARLSWLPINILAVHPLADGVWVAHHNVTVTIDLSFYSYEGHLVRTHALGWAPPELAEPVCLVAHGQNILLSAGQHVLHIQNGHIVSQMELLGRVLQLRVTQPVQPAAFLAMLGSEVVLIAPAKGKKLDSVQLFTSTSAISPRATFFADGRIAVGDESSCLIYSAYPETRLISSVPLSMASGTRRLQPVGYAAWTKQQLAVLSEDGVIDWFG
jgi:tetratricopeptide (TPR) repeat protein